MQVTWKKQIFPITVALATGVASAYAIPEILTHIYVNVFNSTEGRVSPMITVESVTKYHTLTYMIAGSIPGLMLGLMLGTIIARFLGWLKGICDKWWGSMSQGQRVNLFIGVFAGLIASIPFLLFITSLRLVIYVPVAVVALTLGFSALAVYTLKSMEDSLPWTRGQVRARRSGIKILDTNVIIDGRIYDVAKTGFVEGPLYIPGFVLEELQYIADSHDSLRRQRGRRGLDILKRIQSEFPQTEIRIYDKYAPDMGDGVDSRLVRLAQAIGGDLLTNDSNLNRVASLQAVNVLNLNDLALSLRSNILPRETMDIYIAREGSQYGQGVGYLDDGTMVVVENGREHMNKTVKIMVTQVIQTERGKMIFAEMAPVRAERSQASH